MKFSISYKKKSLENAIQYLQQAKTKIVSNQLVERFLEKLSDWIIDKANRHLEASTIGRSIIADIQSSWKKIITGNTVKVVNNHTGAVMDSAAPVNEDFSEVWKNFVNSGKVLMKNPDDYEARANIMWASSMSHNGLTEAGRARYLAVHQLEHALSGEDESISHGAGLAVLFPAWAKYVYKHNIPRFAQFARNIWGICEEDDEKAAVLGIEKTKDYFKFLKMPSSLGEFGIKKEYCEKLSELCTYGKTRVIEGFCPLSFNEVKEIFEISC